MTVSLEKFAREALDKHAPKGTVARSTQDTDALCADIARVGGVFCGLDHGKGGRGA